jgi:hypothetical protein|tara:strand:+ start:460 stop:621 length:162 start_codon:yes stop_codon:yes gene_type:complete
MKLPTNRTGINTIGVAGNLLLAGVIFNSIPEWWLLLSVMLILLGVGLEQKAEK